MNNNACPCCVQNLPVYELKDLCQKCKAPHQIQYTYKDYDEIGGQNSWAHDFDLYNAQLALANITDLPVEAIPVEFFDVFKIISLGAKKYKMNNWLLPDGKRSSEKEMHDSMFHHLAQSFTEKKFALDKESNLDPLLHLACRALMLYTRRKRLITHPNDERI